MRMFARASLCARANTAPRKTRAEPVLAAGGVGLNRYWQVALHSGWSDPSATLPYNLRTFFANLKDEKMVSHCFNLHLLDK